VTDGVSRSLYEQSQHLVCELVTRRRLPGEEGDGGFCWQGVAPLLETGLVVYCGAGDPGLLEGVAKATDRLLGGEATGYPTLPAELAAALRLLTRLYQVGGQRRYKERAAGLAGRLAALYDRTSQRFTAPGGVPPKGPLDAEPVQESGPAVTLMAAAALLVGRVAGVADEEETTLAALSSLHPSWEGFAVSLEVGGGGSVSQPPGPGLRAMLADVALQAYALTGRPEHLKPAVGLLDLGDAPDGEMAAPTPPPAPVDPAGSFWLADVGLAIGHILGREDIEQANRRLLERLAPVAASDLPVVSPADPGPDLIRLLSRLVPALARALTPPIEVVLAGRSHEEDTRRLLQAAAAMFDPALVLITCDPDSDAARLDRFGLPSLSRPAAYVCLRQECSSPINDSLELPRVIADTLRRRRTEPGAI